MFKRLIIITVLIVLAGTAFWFGRGLLVKDAIVDVTRPVRGPAIQAVYATGTVEATIMLPIAARSAARLVELNADEGSQVKKNQVLAKLEDDDLDNSLLELRARETNARLDYERKEELLKNGFATKEVRDRAKADYDAARAAVARVQSQINFMKLLAPADGVIIRRDGEIGELITANQAVFWMSCCAPLRVSAEVDEEDIPLVKPGLKALIHADAFPGQVFEGTVQSITPKGDPIARSYRVRIALPANTPLLIGMTAENNILIGQNDNALLVPTTALHKGKVWVAADGRLESREVTLGAKGPKMMEIKSGLGDEEMIVIEPDAKFKQGENVSTNLVQQKPD